MITPVTTLESIVLASAMGGILGVNGTKFTFTPFSFPDEPVRRKKLLQACGSVPALSMTAVTLRCGSVRSIRAWHDTQLAW